MVLMGELFNDISPYLFTVEITDWYWHDCNQLTVGFTQMFELDLHWINVKNPPHHSDIEHPEDEDEEGLGHSDDEDEGSVEHGQPGDRLGVDNVQDAWRHAELDAAEEAGQGARACDGN